MLSPRSPSQSSYARVLNHIGWSLVIFLAAFSLLSTLDQMLFAPLLTGTVGTAIYGLISSACYMTPFILGGAMFYVFNKKNPTQPVRYGVRLPAVFPLLILAGLAVITASAYVNSWFCTLIGYEIPAELIAPTGYDNPSNVIMYMTVALSPAFAEEFLFRGVIYGNLRPYGKTQAILISATLFALMHQNIGQLFYTFVGGIAMALMYELTGSIWCSIFFHLFNNELSIITEILYYGKLGDGIEPFLMLWDAIVLILGTASILLLILYYRKKSLAKEANMSQGVFGEQGSIDIDVFDDTMSGRAVFSGLRTPGMIVFAALAVVSMLETFLLLQLLSEGIL
ncbi:MAG: CPBP family intramembrane metalloprotease [Oscillospiraceae bacterium]|nr:CPBP family intramembrane metalloprotease [Clostridia bacterium]MBP3699389.1 CPBP family intramembrane metalloprotease [Oscillospiraceae bacterium]